jgi:hypothetical protein
LNKYLKYTLKGLAVFAGVLLLVYTAAYIYVSANKKDIINQIKEQVADKLNGEVHIGDIDLGFLAQFPSISVELNKVSIRDTLFNQHKHPFFQAEKVYASISVINLIQKQDPLNGIRIDKGELYIYTDTSGYTNSYLLSPKSEVKKPTGQSPRKIQIEDVRLNNVRLVLDDRLKLKLYDFDVSKLQCKITTSDSSMRLKTKNDILIHSLAFNTQRGSFVKETRFTGDFTVRFNNASKQLSFEDIRINLKGHPFTLTGAFNFTEVPTFALKVSSKNLDYNLGRSLLTERLASVLSVVKMEKPVNEVSADISGGLKGADPLAKITWKISKNNIQSTFANFTECSFSGGFTNEVVVGLPRKDPNSRLEFHGFTGNWEGLKIASQHIVIDNLTVPMVSCDVKTSFDLSQLNNILQSNTLDMHQGKGSVDLKYTGPLIRNSNKNTLINGKVLFTDGEIHYQPRDLLIKNVSGNILFKNTDVFVNDFRGNVQGNKIVMNGNGKNVLAMMKTNSGKMFLDWNIYSPSLNLGHFMSLLRKRVATKRKSTNSKIGADLDELVTQANFRLDVKADQLTYRRFTASNVKASLILMNENWQLNNVSLQHGGGNMQIAGQLIEKAGGRYYESDIKMNMQNVDVNKVFNAFENFGQDGIEAKNLRGKLTSTADVKMYLDRNLEGAPANIEGFVNFSLKNGALINYEPLQKVQNVAFKKRNFSEIYFAELKNRFDIKNREITINRMEIQSTVLTLFVEGVYSLQGNTDISIQVPLSNLRSREDYTLENKGANSKAGASVYLRGRPGDDGNIQFKLDLFKKFRKNENKESEKVLN